ncbi:MAG TPA: type I DNA topoisomerase [Hyphomonadaceae bacterium]|nr:type I DNA topoisomerase [Hyphomonadaceae bacterium]HPI47894.1 type I DNA topoisomerase [Hyphomonadaceae bacterium]
MQVVVVESPGKVKSINKYLGPGYKVLASYGHIRDLPSKDGSVKPDEDFAMAWDIDGKSIKHVKEIADAVKNADGLILATDPDREGEAISWHVLEALNARKVLKGKTIQRVTFNAITKKAVTEAIENPRQIDQQLVDAYLARRALDYLVGFSLSPVLWRKLPGSRSAGRVQSVALRIVVDREVEIEKFITQEYWQVQTRLAVNGSEFEARLTELDGQKLQKFSLPNAAAAAKALATVKAGAYRVASVEAKPVKRNPPPPFTTSTLQQEAARKLGFSASRTMQIAQRLYEGVQIGGEQVGLITYMRTDGVQMAEEAYAAARSAIGRNYGKDYLPDGPRRYTSKAKNAQEAHEAVRPTDFDRRPGDLHLEPDMARLYELVWKRAVASQMEAASLERTTIEIPSNDRKAVLRATGQVVKFDGFLTLYQEGKDESDDEDGGRLPVINQGDTPKLVEATHTQHFTEPPPRYSEASLVKKLEELGIGRPSTYASTLSTLIDRDYVKLEQKRFIPEDKGRLVTLFLEKFFARYVEYDFTAGLEEKLDLVSDGKLAWKDFLRDFWKEFNGAIGATAELRVSNVIDALNESLGPYLFPKKEDAEGNALDPRVCPTCGTGQLSLKLGKFGAFVGCSNYPECRFTRPFGAEQKGQTDIPPDGKVLGNNPDGIPVFLKSGRFGAYVQLGPDPVEKGEKPKRSSIPNGWSVPDLNLEQGLKLLSLPREVGKHPEDGEPIVSNLGRFGPYVKHLTTYASLPDVNELFEVGLNRAVTLIAEKRAGKGGGRGRQAVAPLKELGKHTDGEVINLFNGRYGPYLKHGTINANIPRGADPASITLEQAIELVDARAAAAPSTKMKGKRGKAPAKKAAKAPAKTAAKAPAKKAAAKSTGDTKSTTTKKPAAKKAAAKSKPAKKATKAEA